MGTLYKKAILFSVLGVLVIAGYTLNLRIRESRIGWSDVPGAVYLKFRPSECPVVEEPAPVAVVVNPISMSDSASLPVNEIATKTFALAVSDVDADGKDDVLIGAHDNNPYLFINTGTGFSDESRALFPEGVTTDRHGYTFADLDNDGDLDLAIASGGQDGVGKGAPNIFLRNDTQHGVLGFSEQSVSAEMAEPAGRTRSLMPLASADGKAVDLYYTGLLRKGFGNALFTNTRHQNEFRFESEPGFLSLSINDHGRGVVADLDGDGNNDYLVIDDWKLKIYWHPQSGRGVSTLSYRAFSTTVADFNNDGRLDIFLGTFATPSRSDNLSYNNSELIYALASNGSRDESSIVFKSQSPELEFDLDQHIPATRARPVKGARDIFLGQQQFNPTSRIFTLDKQRATGKPEAFRRPGIYIWYAIQSDEWNMKWVFHPALDEFKGIIKGAGISDVAKNNFTTNEVGLVTDAIYINEGDGSFSELCTGLVAHRDTTSGSTVADFNNDGWLDIIGLRQGEYGQTNGGLFVLTSNAGTSFSLGTISLREQDRLQRADLIAHGFFDGDDKPDIVSTNGFGQIPGNHGSPRLMFNRTPTHYEALLIDLEGTNSNTFGIGAKLVLTDANGQIIGSRVQGLNANISQDTHAIHFGLGEFPAPYTLTVHWPDHTTSSHEFSGSGRHRVVQQPKTMALPEDMR